MGLDGVELVLECEKSFGIAISEEESAAIRTVDDLYQVILRKFQRNASATGYATSAAFYRLRQGMLACGVDENRVLLTARLDDLLPLQQRRILWKQLAKATALHLPDLEYSMPLTWAVVAACIGSAIAISWALPSMGCFLGPFMILGGLVIFDRLAPYCAGSLPSTCHTIEGLVYRVIALNRDVFTDDGHLTDREIWRILRQIVSEQLGVREEKIEPQTRFVEDLGVG